MLKVLIFWKMGEFMKFNDYYFVEIVVEGIKRVRNLKGKYVFFLELMLNEYVNSCEFCDIMKVGRNFNLKGFGIVILFNLVLRYFF